MGSKHISLVILYILVDNDRFNFDAYTIQSIYSDESETSEFQIARKNHGNDLKWQTWWSHQPLGDYSAEISVEKSKMTLKSLKHPELLNQKASVKRLGVVWVLFLLLCIHSH